MKYTRSAPLRHCWTLTQGGMEIGYGEFIIKVDNVYHDIKDYFQGRDPIKLEMDKSKSSSKSKALIYLSSIGHISDPNKLSYIHKWDKWVYNKLNDYYKICLLENGRPKYHLTMYIETLNQKSVYIPKNDDSQLKS